MTEEKGEDFEVVVRDEVEDDDDAHVRAGREEVNVIPVRIEVEDLNVDVDLSSFGSKMKKKFGAGKDSIDLEKTGAVPKDHKRILKGVTGIKVESGQLLAILGTSGSGKTTFLNTIAGRLDSNTKTNGLIAFNGVNVKDHPQMITNSIGYVMQTDQLLPNLTVRETLQFSALLRLPSSMSKKEKLDYVERVIGELALRDCANTYVGGSTRKGVSGGEKRRVSIGVQMLTNPSVLLLDEPTSGLDSFTAHMMMETLLDLAHSGRTIVCTIHQPRTDIFQLFDLVMLLSKGKLCYFGKATHMIGWLETIGHPCPDQTNPADFALDLVTVDNRTDESGVVTTERLDQITQAFGDRELDYTKEEPIKKGEGRVQRRKIEKRRGFSRKKIVSDDDINAPLLNKKKSNRIGFFPQTYVLTQRAVKNVVRDPIVFMARLVESLIMAVLAGLIFYKAGNDPSGLVSQKAFYYVCASLQPYIIVIVTILQYSEELLVFDREYYDNMIDAAPWWFASRLSMLPIDLIFPIMFATIIYWMAVPLDVTSGQKYIIFTGVNVLIQYSATCLALAGSSLLRDFGQASLLINIFIAFWSYSTGFLLNSHDFPPYLGWISYISPWQYGFAALTTNQFDGLYNCPYAPQDPRCATYNGELVLQSLQLKSRNIGFNIGMIVVIGAVCALISLFALRFIKHRPK